MQNVFAGNQSSIESVLSTDSGWFIDSSKNVSLNCFSEQNAVDDESLHGENWLYHYRAGYFLETHLLDSHIQFPPVTV